MFKKPALLTAFGIGYLLGARAGRERYDAIVAKAQGLWQDPRVQQKAHHARVVAEETADTARHAVQEKVQDKMPGHTSTGSTGSTSSHQTTPSAPSPAASADPVTGTPRGWES
ncbi:hypothetical protein [Nocardioides albus]|uniref:YtxH domain-containing protein n=1 Tax=Nocardioides albus TaxID=1841 RepID=A0A7W5A5H6_9ACTN|nr:hypothetical protein [Nocardioides albus]MBB3089765.1 hypothetical protein [Nocardioides albus]GGU35470.1 hypothetical protein GCM10007979_38080 [Nocardioides albus]